MKNFAILFLVVLIGLTSIGCGKSPHAGLYMGKGTLDGTSGKQAVEVTLDLRPDGKYTLRLKEGVNTREEHGAWDDEGSKLKLSTREGYLSWGHTKDIQILSGGKGLSMTSDTKMLEVAFGPKA